MESKESHLELEDALDEPVRRSRRRKRAWLVDELGWLGLGRTMNPD